MITFLPMSDRSGAYNRYTGIYITLLEENKENETLELTIKRAKLPSKPRNETGAVGKGPVSVLVGKEPIQVAEEVCEIARLYYEGG